MTTKTLHGRVCIPGTKDDAKKAVALMLAIAKILGNEKALAQGQKDAEAWLKAKADARKVAGTTRAMMNEEAVLRYNVPNNGGTFVYASGTLIWEGPGGAPGIGAASAPAEALAYFGMFCIGLIASATEACGFFNVSAAGFHAQWAAVTLEWGQVVDDLAYVWACANTGSEGAPQY